jgi:hypothetical protein
MLERPRPSLREQPLRHGHHLDQKKVISFLPFENLTTHSSCLKASYECICCLLVIVVPDDELDINALNGFGKGMHRLHPILAGEDLECYCGDVCKMEVSGNYNTLWRQF